MGACLSLSWYDNAKAEFVLNWTADQTTPEFQGTTEFHGGSAIPGAQTPFIYERVLDSSNVPYYHMVIGDPNSDFAQEVYIQVGGPNIAGQSIVIGGIGPQGSASSGTPQALGNGQDPLGPVDFSTVSGERYTGNSSGNPTRVQMQQVNTDGDLSVEFTKDKFAEKPSITNNISSTDFSATFKVDSTGNGYSASTPSTVTNKVEITDPTTQQQVGNFDMTADAQGSHITVSGRDTDDQDSNVTAGRYTYTPGAGNMGSRGTYTYSEGSANLNPDWSSYFDDREANPWAYPANRP
jgi:hypothetical protein